jgi:uncharacterized protein YggE
MRKSAVIFLPVLCSVAFAQLDSNSITVSASNNASLQPDQAVFAVSVQSGMNTGLDDVLTALQGSGITAANFSSIGSSQQTISNGDGTSSVTVTLTWVFSLPVALANTKTTVASLAALQQSVAKLNNAMTLSFSIVGTQVSQQLAQSQTCSIAGLLATATTQAQSLAAAAGVTLGSIAAMSSVTANVAFVTSPILLSGSLISNIASGATPPPCSITVKFNVNRN